MWFILISIALLIASALPYLPLTHWFYRFFEFGKIQILILQIITLALSFVLVQESHTMIQALQLLTFFSILFHLATLYKYTTFYKTIPEDHSNISSKTISVLSANVFQENTNYDSFIALIHKNDPDIFLTMESDSKWEKALSVLNAKYPYNIKVGLSNTYGMHFYSKLKIINHTVHYFVADDLPSIEAQLLTPDGYKFTFFAVHPPPPSPTEETNSKERDGELLSIAKKIKQNSDTSVVVGDFNNVAWAKTSILFRKTSETLDGRMGRGFISSYHTKYWFLRFPIDLMFHTPDVFIDDLKTLEHFGSDHFPIYLKFYINKKSSKQEHLTENLEEGEQEVVEEIISEGVNEKSDNRN